LFSVVAGVWTELWSVVDAPALGSVLRIDVSGATLTVLTTVTNAPVAVNDNYSVGEGDELNVSVPGVLGNDSDAGERYNRAARVVAGWVRDKDFSDAAGNPKALALQDGESPKRASFADLVRRFSGDIPFRAVLDELLRVGVVEKLGDSTVELKTRAYVPESGDADMLTILGTDVADLVATIDHNLQRDGSDPFFQRKVMYDNVPVETLEEFRRLSNAQARPARRLNKWLSRRPLVSKSRERAGWADRAPAVGLLLQRGRVCQRHPE
jgi:hypothetical protein